MKGALLKYEYKRGDRTIDDLNMPLINPLQELSLWMSPNVRSNNRHIFFIRRLS